MRILQHYQKLQRLAIPPARFQEYATEFDFSQRGGLIQRPLGAVLVEAFLGFQSGLVFDEHAAFFLLTGQPQIVHLPPSNLSQVAVCSPEQIS